MVQVKKQRPRGIWLDSRCWEVQVDGKPLYGLTYTEFKVLQLLLDRRGGVCTRNEIIKHAEIEVLRDYDNRAVDQHIKRLRHKMGSPRYIETVLNVGYKINRRFHAQ